MRITLAAVMIALATAPGLIVLVAAPSLAQISVKEPQKAAPPPKKKEDDKDYKSALERMPDQKFDPWRDMR